MVNTNLCICKSHNAIWNNQANYTHNLAKETDPFLAFLLPNVVLQNVFSVSVAQLLSMLSAFILL